MITIKQRDTTEDIIILGHAIGSIAGDYMMGYATIAQAKEEITKCLDGIKAKLAALEAAYETD